MGTYLERSATYFTDVEGRKSEAEKEPLQRQQQGTDGRIILLKIRLGIPGVML